MRKVMSICPSWANHSRLRNQNNGFNPFDKTLLCVWRSKHREAVVSKVDIGKFRSDQVAKPSHTLLKKPRNPHHRQRIPFTIQQQRIP